ncbi:MAG TPA: hypothetical protein VG125_08855, partial [Pirellulales bacterium]|nr:hypothetical protein [Pirellulales bacterium]
MRGASMAGAVVWLALTGFVPPSCPAQTVTDSDFSKGDFASLGWKADGAWDIFRYPHDSPDNPGPVARFAANKPGGSLTRRFTTIDSPRQLKLSLEYGWGWGEAGQGADSVSFMLLDDKGDGYVFEVHRFKAPWAVQWG